MHWCSKYLFFSSSCSTWQWWQLYIPLHLSLLLERAPTICLPGIHTRTFPLSVSELMWFQKHCFHLLWVPGSPWIPAGPGGPTSPLGPGAPSRPGSPSRPGAPSRPGNPSRPAGPAFTGQPFSLISCNCKTFNCDFTCHSLKKPKRHSLDDLWSTITSPRDE